MLAMIVFVSPLSEEEKEEEESKPAHLHSIPYFIRMWFDLI